MGKGNRDKKSKEFKNSPFGNLKGLSVSPPDKPGKPQASRPPAPPAPAPSAPVPSGADLFAEEMARLGVRPRSAEELPVDAGPQPTGRSPEDPPRPSAPADPEAQFLEAIGRLDATFADRYPDEELEQSDHARHASPRRMRQLRQGQIVPDGQLDLHGLHRDQALDKVRWYLQDAAWQGLRTILVITGRGKNSPEGPVLRDAVARYLDSGGDGQVLEWGPAPPRFGGEGALVVFLRGQPKT